MKVKDSKAAIEFLEEASRYFEKRPTHGEDKAYWSNVYNAENCLEIVKLIEAKDSQIRTLEKGVLDLSVDVNDQVKEIERLKRYNSDHIEKKTLAFEERSRLRSQNGRLVAALKETIKELEYMELWQLSVQLRKALETKDD